MDAKTLRTSSSHPKKDVKERRGRREGGGREEGEREELEGREGREKANEAAP